jgi:hypothetical protein
MQSEELAQQFARAHIACMPLNVIVLNHCGFVPCLDSCPRFAGFATMAPKQRRAGGNPHTKRQQDDINMHCFQKFTPVRAHILAIQRLWDGRKPPLHFAHGIEATRYHDVLNPAVAAGAGPWGHPKNQVSRKGNGARNLDHDKAQEGNEMVAEEKMSRTGRQVV